MKHLAWLATASLALAAPGLAQAADAYLAGDADLRAGPDSSYPLIDQIQAGTEVDVQGCTEGWAWCDVIVYGDRGWVAGNYIEYEYRDQPVPLPDYGARIGIPIISFAIGNYWDRHYRGRPFYGERDDWYRRSIERREPPSRPHDPYRGPVRRAGEDGRPVRIFHPPVGRPGQLGPVGPGHPVYRIPESSESRSRANERNTRSPVQRPPAARSQPARPASAPPARHADKHDH